MHLVLGMLAHVDAGKTTLSEAILYRAGAIRRLGRVDHRDAFLDTDEIERERGITIFSKQALFRLGETCVTLLDTPGHADFSSEMERTLQVLDCAVVVVSGTDGVQSHTLTVWQLLRRYGVPTFLFVNKMDLHTPDRAALMEELRRRLDEGCVDFTLPASRRDEAAALGSEAALDEFLSRGALSEDTLRSLVADRKLFPCCFGSALSLDGVDALLDALARFAPRPERPPTFGARVFKITRDGRGARLTWMKITGGALRAKTVLTGGDDGEKVDLLRVYSGERFTLTEQAEAGSICAATGLERTYAGQGFGSESGSDAPLLSPVLSCQVLLPEGCDPHAAMEKLCRLEEEDPQLHVVWDSLLRQIRIQLMGQVQLEVLRRVIAQRFDLAVDFGPGSIIYKETIADAVEGVGHFEPLRHYAEVRLLLEPGAPGSGLVLDANCPPDSLEPSWQRLVLTHLREKEHQGVLIGAPVTDLKITLIAGRAHPKHTEGGDFRQATYRAVRHALMQAKSILLEPWYAFSIELPAECAGRAMADVQTMGGSFRAPEQAGDTVLLQGEAPVFGMQEYAQTLTAYTRGRGMLSCRPSLYRPCPRAESVIAERGYDPERDTANPADSVFCSHGAGVIVPWREVAEHAHVPSPLRRPGGQTPPPPSPAGGATRPPAGTAAEEKELQEIFERTYGKAEPRAFRPVKKPARTTLADKPYVFSPKPAGDRYLLVDGYNVIFAWDDLKRLAEQDVSAARAALTELLVNYQSVRGCRVILVFDAYKVKGNPGSMETVGGVCVVYTRQAQTADAYIEEATYVLQKEHEVRVATSDALEQLIILGHGALRVSARAFRQELDETLHEIDRLLARYANSAGAPRVGEVARIVPRERAEN